MLALLASLAFLVTPGAAAAEWPDPTAQIRTTDEGRADAAVIVAIEDYAKVDDVAGARANADAWMEWFVRGRGVPAARVLKAYDGDATDIQIRELAQRAAASVGEGGTLWFVFIGHGAPSKDGRDGLLVGVDADRSAQGIYQRSVSRSELLGLLDAGPQARTVALIDACFSGQSPGGAALVEGLQPLVPTALVAEASKRTRVLTAAGSGEFSGPLPGASRPAFSYLALGGLVGWADAEGDKDGRVSASELRDYVAGALNLTVSGRTQTPGLLGSDTDLAKSAGAKAPDLFAILKSDTGNGTRIQLGGDTELAKLAAEAARKAEERRLREQEEARAVRDLEQARQARYDDAAREVRAAAAADFAALQPLLTADGPSPEAMTVLDAFERRYGKASVDVDGTSLPIEVPEVQRVRDAMARSSRGTTLGELRRVGGGYVSVADVEAGYSEPLRIRNLRELRKVATQFDCEGWLVRDRGMSGLVAALSALPLTLTVVLAGLAASDRVSTPQPVALASASFGAVGVSMIAFTRHPKMDYTTACLADVPRSAVRDALDD